MGYGITMTDSVFRVKSENFGKVYKSLIDYGYSPETDQDGNVIDLEFAGEKLGSDFAMFQKIAPYVEPGSFIQMCGDDGEQLRWVFKNSRCYEITPRIIWPEPK